MSAKEDRDLEAAIPAVIELAEKLEADGFAHSVIADVLMCGGLMLGNALQGAKATALVLSRLSAKIAADEAAENSGYRAVRH